MKWDKVFLIGDTEDDITRKSFYRYKRRYKIPDHRCFFVASAGSGKDNVQGARPIRPQCLNEIDESSKLIVVAHGSPDAVWFSGDSYCHERFVIEYLYKLAVKKVGLISFKACDIGKADYLVNLLQTASNLGLEIGWLLGYKHKAHGYGSLIGDGFNGEFAGGLDKWIRGFTFALFKASDSYRIKIVKGNIDVTPRKSSRRYRS